VGAERDQPGVDESLPDRRHLRRLHARARPGELPQMRPPTGDFGARPELDQADQHLLRDALLVFRQRVVERVGTLLERAADAADLLVSLHREPATRAAMPELEQRVLEQREGADLAAELSEDRVD